MDQCSGSISEMTWRVGVCFDQFDKAVELLVKSKQVDSALDLCLSHHIRLTEEILETMTPVKREGGEWGVGGCWRVGVGGVSGWLWMGVSTCMCVTH